MMSSEELEKTISVSRPVFPPHFTFLGREKSIANFSQEMMIAV